jgi:uncharacterized protein (TIGR00369 family)
MRGVGQMTDGQDLKLWQERLDISPFQCWLGLRAVEVGEGKLVIAMDWRPEMVSNPQTRSLHGGILASLVDLGGLYAVLTTKSLAVATVDLRVDYHRPSSGGRLLAHSSVLRLGSKVSSAETRIVDADGGLIASGRGVYLMAQQS